MGKWSHLKETLPRAPLDAKFQVKVDELKKRLADRSLDKLVETYDLVETERENLEREVELTNVYLTALGALLVDRLEAAGQTLVRFEGNGTISLLDLPLIEIADPVAFRGWVDQNVPELLQLHWQTRDKLVKDRLEAGSPLPPGTTVKAVMTRISRRKS